MDTSISARADDCEADRRAPARTRLRAATSGSLDDQQPDSESDEPEPARAGVHVEVSMHEALGEPAINVAWVREKTGEALRLLGCLRGELSIVIVGDEIMRDAHRQSLGIDTTTDVLTFDLAEEPADAGAIDAEVFICLDEAARQAGVREHCLERELLLYIIHGILHCLGYDDQDETQFQRMHRREDEVLSQLGVGATFFRSPPPDSGDGHASNDNREDMTTR